MGAGDRTRRPLESREHTVAGAPDFVAAVAGELSTHRGVVRL
jgi:hypothetical protein